MASSSVKITLKDPVQFGESETITELELTPKARDFKDFSLKMTADGAVMYEPYALASVGVKMAGRPDVVLDKLSVRDMQAVAQVVMGFFV